MKYSNAGTLTVVVETHSSESHHFTRPRTHSRSHSLAASLGLFAMNWVTLLLLLQLCGVINSFTLSRSMMLSMSSSDSDTVKRVGVVLLAGGKGKRMKSNVPKQFLPILGKPVFIRSLDIFRNFDREGNNH